MKPTILLTLVVIGGLLGIHKTKAAEVIYQNGYQSTNIFTDVTFACVGDPQYYNFSQRLYGTDGNTSFPPVALSKFVFAHKQTGTCGSGNRVVSCTLGLYSNYSDSTATSTYSFNFDIADDETEVPIYPAYVADSAHPIEKISVNCGALIPSYAWALGTTRMAYSSQHCSGQWCFGGDYELAFKLYRSDATLTINSPRSSVRQSFRVQGNCSQSVRYCLQNEFTTASSTSIYCSTASCTNDAWQSIAFTGLTPKLWFANASSTEGQYEKTDSTMFLYASNMPLPDDFGDFIDEVANPGSIIGPVSGADSVMGNTVDVLTTLRPLSYIKDIYDIMRNAAFTPTSTTFSIGYTTTTSTSAYIGSNIPLVSKSTLDNFLPSADWTGFKTIVTGVLYLGFALYLYRRVRKFV